MKHTEERRTPGVSRVPLATLVEICGYDGKVPPFEGESTNVSGRGMQVRTSYLPGIGQTLVCRFEHEGAEILVEGRVAWRSEGTDGGEFGIQFTALDTQSAGLLQNLGAPEHAIVQAAPHSASLADDDEDDDQGVARLPAESGDRVRLHIDGLGAPMRARVHEGSSRKVLVGSNLEFLKVGRSLQMENVDVGERSGAHVEAVNVMVNPATQIPELVVMLRYEGADRTPEPMLVARAAEAHEEAHTATPDDGDEPGPFDETGATPRTASFEDDDVLSGADLPHVSERRQSNGEGDLTDWMPSSNEIKDRVEGVALGAVQLAKGAKGLLGRLAHGAAEQASAARAASRERRSTKARKRRTASVPVGHRSPVSSLRGATSRPTATSNPRRARTEAPLPKKTATKARRVLAMTGLLALAGSAFAVRGLFSDGEEQVLSKPVPQEEVAAPASAAAAEAPVAAPAPAKKSDGGIVADVPLFGPTPVATAELAPLAAKDEVDDAEAERLAAAASVDDESWDEPESAKPAADSKPWGQGRLHLPTIHRIRLDGVGSSLAGAVNPAGFTVVVPGRKPMETGRAIQSRDKRIAAVEASQTEQGARVSFKFRGKVPAYRVRLRGDFVEFLISAPEGEAAKL